MSGFVLPECSPAIAIQAGRDHKFRLGPRKFLCLIFMPLTVPGSSTPCGEVDARLSSFTAATGAPTFGNSRCRP